MQKKRYVLIGCGSRSRPYIRALLQDYKTNSQIIAICEPNEGRAADGNDLFESMGGRRVPVYHPDDFSTLIRSEKPDTALVVSGPDSTHARYIVESLDAGLDVITEKPMVTTLEDVTAVRNAVEGSGRHCQVTFNCRYMPARAQVKRLLQKGAVGPVSGVNFFWYLDTVHGADYFRRWHRRRSNSGSLLIHKATHHFDLANWWIGSRPQTVFARGSKSYYRPETAQRFGLNDRAERCRECREQSRCPFYLDLEKDEKLKNLYLANEEYDGYFRDRCIFAEEIDIWDTMALTVGYENGALMTYLLTAFAPAEGYRICLDGLEGRLEHGIGHSELKRSPEGRQERSRSDAIQIRLTKEFSPPQDISPEVKSGGHGGGDPLLYSDLFSGIEREDELQQKADYRDGIYSVMIGIAALRSIDSGDDVSIPELLAEG